jgi:hypothetical protein
LLKYASREGRLEGERERRETRPITNKMVARNRGPPLDYCCLHCCHALDCGTHDNCTDCTYNPDCPSGGVDSFNDYVPFTLRPSKPSPPHSRSRSAMYGGGGLGESTTTAAAATTSKAQSNAKCSQDDGAGGGGLGLGGVLTFWKSRPKTCEKGTTSDVISESKERGAQALPSNRSYEAEGNHVSKKKDVHVDVQEKPNGGT